MNKHHIVEYMEIIFACIVLLTIYYQIIKMYLHDKLMAEFKPQRKLKTYKRSVVKIDKN